MTDALFDLTPYGGPPKPPRARNAKPPADTVEVAGAAWNGASKTTPGVMHYVVGRKVIRRLGGDVAEIVSACGIAVVPHTFDPDEVRVGCARCDRLKP